MAVYHWTERPGRVFSGGMRHELVTLLPAGSTGWHTHPAPLFVHVVSGVLTHYDSAGRVTTVGPGDAFVEPSGPAAVHRGVNHGAVEVVLDVVYVVMRGRPLREDAAMPECYGRSVQLAQTPNTSTV